MQLFLAQTSTPLGAMTAISSAAGVVALDFEGHTPTFSDATFHEGDPHGVIAALDAYFGGALDALEDLPVDPQGTDFQQRVWAALRGVRPGRTTSYGALAAALGSPGASRAVGAANGANRVALIIPCHRVVGADGSLTGYAGGVWRKRWLLEHESGRAQATLGF
ncbi:MAG: methylated-DNA--[protein]-cysteine S-methyltransferase [Alphaproteobacteria bacterium]|nr:methylated-DNA--[protein]-cysteine S-methyltransferase [Alphaproteobacteria bacterium]